MTMKPLRTTQRYEISVNRAERHKQAMRAPNDQKGVDSLFPWEQPANPARSPPSHRAGQLWLRPAPTGAGGSTL